MTREIYIPLMDSFFESSIMHEDLAVRWVMLGLIRFAWRPQANGVVDVDPRIFAASLNLPLADVEKAITRLMEPDPLSACPDEGGRRIVPVDPERPFRNWRLVNWPKYRAMVHNSSAANRMAALREQRAEMFRNVPDVPHVPTIRDETNKRGSSLLPPSSLTPTDISTPKLEGVATQVSLLPLAGPAFCVVGRKRAEWKATTALIEDLIRLYPNVDVMREMDKAASKLRERVVTRKTPKGMPRFLHSWMERVQNSSHGVRAPSPPELDETQRAAKAKAMVEAAKAKLKRGETI